MNFNHNSKTSSSFASIGNDTFPANTESNDLFDASEETLANLFSQNQEGPMMSLLQDDDQILTVSMFRTMMDSYMERIIEAVQRSSPRRYPCKYRENDSTERYRNTNYFLLLLCLIAACADQGASLDLFCQVLKKLYGTKGQKQTLFSNPNQFGERNFARGEKAYNLKSRFMAVMATYYEQQNFEMDNIQLEQRYSNTYDAVRNFVIVQVIPSNPLMSCWTNLVPLQQTLFSLMVENYIEVHLGSGEKGMGLPLFCTVNHYAANFFLTNTIRSLTKAKRSLAIGRIPAIEEVSVNLTTFKNLILKAIMLYY